MNALRPEPVTPLPYHGGDLMHSSTRTSMSTNADSDVNRPARMTISTTRLEMRVLDGQLEIRFAEHQVDGLPTRPAANRPIRWGPA